MKRKPEFINIFETQELKNERRKYGKKVKPSKLIKVFGDVDLSGGNSDDELVIKYIITDISEPTLLAPIDYIQEYASNPTSLSDLVSKIVIDDVEVPLESFTGVYQFSSTGIHIVKYTVKKDFLGFDMDPDTQSINVGPTFYSVYNIVEVFIPNKIKYVLINAFANCPNLTYVHIPDSIQNIGTDRMVFDKLNSAMMGPFVDTHLFNISIPNNVVKFGVGAFVTTPIQSILIPKTVTTIAKTAFINNEQLKVIRVDPDNPVYDSRNRCSCIIETASNTLVAGCVESEIPNDVTSIGDFAFMSINLENIIIPSSITSIGNKAFFGCQELTSITCLATTAPTLGNDVFENVSGTGTLTIPSGATGYDNWIGTVLPSGWTIEEM